MRLWSIHPKYLDQKGLLALWREGLLAQKVLLGATKGYRNHPQLNRFYAAADPVAAISRYLAEVAAEASNRGYAFDASKIVKPGNVAKIQVRIGQVEYEWQHLLRKLLIRAPGIYEMNRRVVQPEVHPSFRVVSGEIEEWEKVTH